VSIRRDSDQRKSEMIECSDLSVQRDDNYTAVFGKLKVPIMSDIGISLSVAAANVRLSTAAGRVADGVRRWTDGILES